MTIKTDGGPAFPMPEYLDIEGSRVWGISQRDYFAGKALHSVILTCANDTREEGETHESMFAKKAYAIADAMLEARVRRL